MSLISECLGVSLESARGAIQNLIEMQTWGNVKPTPFSTVIEEIENAMVKDVFISPMPRIPHSLVGLLAMHGGGQPSRSKFKNYRVHSILNVVASGKTKSLAEIYKLYQDERAKVAQYTWSEVPFAIGQNGDLFIYKLPDWNKPEGIYYWSQKSNETVLLLDGADNLSDLFISMLG